MAFTIPTNVVTVEPSIEPVTFEDVKANAWIVDNEDFKFVSEDLIPTARRYVEELAKRSLITQTRKQSYDYMPCDPVYLRYGPVQSVSSFSYTDENEAVQTLATTRYSVDTSRIPGRVMVAYNQTWPTSIRKVNSINITYVAGYGSTPASVPRIYRRAIIVICTHWYNNRTSFACGSLEEEMLKQLENMLSVEGRTVEYA